MSETQPNFSDLGLSPKVLEAIATAGYTTPTPIQTQAIPSAVAGKDVLGIAQTGTGKTASFVLPMLTRLEQGRARARMPRSLILCPTRELAAQVAENFERYGLNHKIDMALLIGGVSFDEQNRKLDRGVDVLIATPGRLLDHFQRGKLLMTGVEILVIDEADRMLDMGFIPDIERICGLLPPRRQTLFFSATMPPEIQRLVDRFLKSPTRVEVAPQATTASTIMQKFQFVDGGDYEKREALRQLIRTSDVKNAIIFCNRKRDVDVLYKSLIKHGFNAGCLHGDMDQHTRTATLDGFRSGSIMLLAASDVAARGLDIPDVSHVFNFDVPIHADDYVHRIGRTGRAGRKGASITLVADEDMRILREIEKIVNATLEWIGDPPPADAGTKRRGRGARRSGPPAGERRGPQRGGRREPRRNEQADVAVTPGAAAGGQAIRQLEPVAAAPALQTETVAQHHLEPRNNAPADAPRERKAGTRGRRREGSRSEERQADQSRSGGERAQGTRRESHRDAPPEPGFGQPSLSERSEQKPRSQRADRPPRREPRDDSPPVVGLGDHMPDFLKRPIKQPGR